MLSNTSEMDTMLSHWPNTTDSTNNKLSKLSTANLVAIICVNIGLVGLVWILLRVILKPTTTDTEEPKIHTTSENEHTSLLTDDINREKTATGLRIIHEGECGGEYSEKWTSTFDLIFVIIMIVLLLINCFLTIIYAPALWSDWIFWLTNIVMFFLIMIVLICGGLLCRHYCQTDDKGYIITNRYSAFKVNYTKKFQHFACYVFPLLATNINSYHSDYNDWIGLLWSYYFTCLILLLLIKPIRERSKFFMIQFNSIDRPEDRPNTLLWIVAGNNIPGFMATVFFRWLYPFTGLHRDLVNIFVLINTIGDGLAEPVGIYFGKHRYKTRGCFNKTQYERSLEGSSCVFITSVVLTSIFWYAFNNFIQFWITICILPFIMAVTEATSPHTCDSVFITTIGGLTLFIISHLYIKWI